MKLIPIEQIKRLLPGLDILTPIEEGFMAYSNRRAVIPPVGELILEKGEVHIKYGYVKEEEFYVVKVASGFYGNPAMGLSSSNGLMLLFSQRTGELVSVLLDEGYLTDVRTAVAGAIAARVLAPSEVEGIGVLGTGIQARMQVQYLKEVVGCRELWVWGRREEAVRQYCADMTKAGFRVEVAHRIPDIPKRCNLIVTATPSTLPLLQWEDIRPGTHVTAMGSDTPEKQELDPQILHHADVVVGDSLDQCLVRGEISHAIRAGAIAREKVIELGQVLADPLRGRTSDRQVTVADLTGVAVQDIAIVTAVYRACRES